MNVSFRVAAPGIILSILIALFAYLAVFLLSRYFTGYSLPVSPVLFAMIIGILISNTLKLPVRCRDGIRFCMKTVLRLGIVLLGIRLSVFAVLRIGITAACLVTLCIITALIVTAIVSRALGISRKLGLLIAAGTSICGVSAIIAAAPAIDADEEETAYAVGIVTLFGLAAVITYPYLVELVLHLSTSAAGFFLGTSIHDTSQVTAASLIYDQLWTGPDIDSLSGSDVAVTVKLVRNTFMVVVIPLISILGSQKVRKKNTVRSSFTEHIPLFVIGYLIFGILRTFGDALFGSDYMHWFRFCQSTASAATWLITVAIAAVGLNTDISKMTKLGLRPLFCGLSAALSVGFVSWILVIVFSDVISLF